MNYIWKIGSYINRLSKNHKALFVLYIIILMFTNTILLFTEPMGFAARFAFILMPLGLQILLLAAVKKPALMFLILLPKSVLDAFQLVLIKLYGGSIIAVDMFLNVVTTNPTEAGELLSNIAPVVLFLVAVYVPAILLGIRSLKKNAEYYMPFRKKMIKAGGIVTAVSLVFFTMAEYSKGGLQVKYDIYPLNVMYNLDFAVKKWNKINNSSSTSKDFTYNSVKAETPANGKREIYILMIGETARAQSWGLYGYERSTTPYLDTTSNLAVFSDALTQSNTTHKSVPMILTPASADNHDLIYKCKSVVTLFKEAGFKTAYLTNHTYSQTFMDNYYKEADIAISFTNMGTHRYDYVMADSLESILQRDTVNNLFVVMHLYGSHFHYYQRYNKNFAKFVPDMAETISPKYKQELINSYDNSILSTDYVIHNVIDAVRKQQANSFVMYASDHGEDLMDDRRKRFLHASPIPTFYQLHVPFVMWFSDGYKESYEGKYNAVMANCSAPVSTNSVIFHSLGDMAGIESVYVKDTLSVGSANFNMGVRRYLTDHDGSIAISELPLKKPDYEQFEERGLFLE